MKRNLLFGLALIFICGALAVYVLAQRPAASNSPTKLAKAIVLIQADRPAEAKELLAAIGPDDPAYAAAQRYRALCLYALKDEISFLKAVGSLDLSEPVVAPEVQEELAFKQIDVLFYFRRFEDIFGRIQAFQAEYPSSVKLTAVVEYQMAALFERGLKKAIEAGNLKDETQSDRRRAEAETNLFEFLLLAASFPDTNYIFLPKRALREDVWVARMTLGDEDSMLNEIPVQDMATREKLGFLRLRLYQKLRPDRVDQNLRMMSDFIAAFPNSLNRPRVEFDLANIAFHQGERLCREAETAEMAGDTNNAAVKRTAARSYFNLAKPLQNQAVEDKAAGLEASDLRELHEGLLCSYYWERDYANLAAHTKAMIARSTPDDDEWLRAKLFDGAVLGRQTPPQLNQAAAIFDEILACGFRNRPAHDRFVGMAARWRVYTALQSGDLNKAKAVVKWVQASDCTKNIKDAFLKDYAALAAQ